MRPSRNQEDAVALSDFGIASISVPLIGISNFINPAGVARLLTEMTSGKRVWFIATSSNAIDAFISQADAAELSLALSNPNLRFAAVGDSSAASLRAIVKMEVLVPEVQDAFSLAALIIDLESQDKIMGQKASVVMPIGSRSLVVAQKKLASAGFYVISEIFYQNLPLAISELDRVALNKKDIDLVVFRSPSSAKAYFAIQGLPARRIVSVGATTASAIRELGFAPDLICLEMSSVSVAKKIAEYRKIGALK